MSTLVPVVCVCVVCGVSCVVCVVWVGRWEGGRKKGRGEASTMMAGVVPYLL